MNKQTHQNLPKPAENWRPPTLIEQENEIEWLYSSVLFPALRFDWALVCGRGRIPLKWPDNRLVVAMSRLGHEAESVDTSPRRFYRRVFFLLPRDIYLIRAHLQAVCAGYRMLLHDMPTRKTDDFLPSSMDWVSTFSVWPGEEHSPQSWQCYERMAPYFAANLAVILARWHFRQVENRDDARQRQIESRARRAKAVVTKPKKPKKPKNPPSNVQIKRAKL